MWSTRVSASRCRRRRCGWPKRRWSAPIRKSAWARQASWNDSSREQNAATQRIALTQFEFQLTQFEDVLRRQIGADLDPDARKLRLELTEDVTKAPDEAIYDKESLVGVALQKRPDLRAVKANLTVNDYQLQHPRIAEAADEPVGVLSNLRAGRTALRHRPSRAVPGGAADAWGEARCSASTTPPTTSRST